MIKGRAFRIGHLGDFNDLMLAGTLCAVEMGLALAGVPFNRGGVGAAMASLCVSEELGAKVQDARGFDAPAPSSQLLLVPCKHRLPLGNKRGNALAKVVAAITQGQQIFVLDRVETTVQREAVTGGLGGANGQRRVAGNGLRELEYRRVNRVRVDEACHQSERCRLGGVDEPSGEEQILGPRRADQIHEARAVGG